MIWRNIEFQVENSGRKKESMQLYFSYGACFQYLLIAIRFQGLSLARFPLVKARNLFFVDGLFVILLLLLEFGFQLR